MSTNKTIYMVLLMGLTSLVMASIFSSYLSFREIRDFSRVTLLLEPVLKSELLVVTESTLQFREGTLDIARNRLIIRDAEIIVPAEFEVNRVDRVELITGGSQVTYPTDRLIELIIKVGKHSEVIYYVD